MAHRLPTVLWLVLLAVLLASGPALAQAPSPESQLDPDLLRQIQVANRREAELESDAGRAQEEEQRRHEALQRDAQKEAEVRLRASRAEQDALRAKIANEVAYQTELMRRSQADSETTPADPANSAAEFLDPSYLAATDPRTADPAPELRDLPDAIFDEDEVRVEPGTWDNTRALELVRQVLDADGDKAPELVRYLAPDTRLLLRQHEDRDFDGQMDAWSKFEYGEFAARSLDTDEDGRPDVWETYRAGWLATREIDRNGDTVRDVFFIYDNGELIAERHDANNDSTIDLIIVYQGRIRQRSEEDHDKDGRMDIWTWYRVENGEEQVHRIERDTAGRGFADVFDTFVSVGGRALLAESDKDVNGDGKIDIIRFYRNGKLVRMEVADPEMM